MRFFLFIPSIGSQREGTKSAIKFKSFQKVYNCLLFTREFRIACTTKKQHTLQIVHGFLADEYDTYCRIYERILAHEGATFWALREKSAHYICRFTSTLSNSNYISPSLNSHGKRHLVWYFFKNSKYVYNILSYKSLGKGRKLRHKRKYPHLLPSNCCF